MPAYKVGLDQLRVGVFIKLDLKWFEHPFSFSSFKITSQEQINILRDLRLQNVLCIPEKSDILPMRVNQSVSSAEQGPTAQATPGPDSADTQKLWEIKKERIERVKARREKDKQCEQRFHQSVTAVKDVMKGIESGSKEAFEEADKLMNGIAESLMPDKESAVQLMNTKFGKEDLFYHSLNVAVLSMMLGREYGLDGNSIRLLGLCALFHDIGKSRIPKSILRKATPLTSAELSFYQLHPQYGFEMLSRLDLLPGEVAETALQHHETVNGSGYPKRLDGPVISVCSRIVSIVNVYDAHCNKSNIEDSKTPYEALSYMFSIQKDMFDSKLLQMFIKCLGVYPPGTLVKLSNGFTGIVISVNPLSPLNPSLLLYDPEIPQSEALIIDMSEDTSFKIEHCVKPSQLSQEAYAYLNPRTRVTYFFGEPGTEYSDIQKNPV